MGSGRPSSEAPDLTPRAYRHGMHLHPEEPFLASDQRWTRASLVVNGTPPTTMPAYTLVAPGPLTI